jgi:hypothetical protein
VKILILEGKGNEAGPIYGAFQSDLRPLDIQDVTAEGCHQQILSQYPDAEVELPPHEHHPAAVHSAPSPPGLRRTGVHQMEFCRCGMKRHVWITTFKVEAGAWE